MTKQHSNIVTKQLKIGLLGGSFNPAHEGHLHISEIARKELGLSQVWWLVSPQNPLKSSKDMMSFEMRFASAAKIRNSNPKVKISDLESRLSTRFTIDTLKRLKQKYPCTKFYFLMGADNLIQLTKWKKWRDIFKYAEVHVFDRDELAYPAIKSRAAVTNNIHYHRISLCKQSSTQIRNCHKD
jgi:nicotinate-nucleotide adenylyltransferase